MPMPVAKEGDQVVGVDTHVVMIPSPAGAVPTPMPMPFSGVLQEALSSSVFVDEVGVALVGSVANNVPPHLPMGGPFQTPPSNRATISTGSPSVFVDGKAVARLSDSAKCCNDPTDLETGVVIAASTVFVE
jgi:uncharacterized Zn-binding protein involved in type VI secretion